MKTTHAEVLFRPESLEHRYLPEGLTYDHRLGRLYWVNIQDGRVAHGSVHWLDVATGDHQFLSLAVPPSFLALCDDPDVLLVAAGHDVGLLRLSTGSYRVIKQFPATEGTMTNDAHLSDTRLWLGFKNPDFKTPNADLWLWDTSKPDEQPSAVHVDAVCLNGIKLLRQAGEEQLIYTDTPEKVVSAARVDRHHGLIGNTPVIDVRSESHFPDGNVLLPGGRLVQAFFNPNRVNSGLAREYNLETGEVLSEFVIPGAPRVTIPAVIERSGSFYLVFQTAIEWSSDPGSTADDILEYAPDSGCLFMAPCEETTLPELAVFTVPPGLKP